MRHPMLLPLAAAAVAIVAGYGTASAQSVGVEVYRGDPYYSYGYDSRYERSPRVYGYYRSDTDLPDVAIQVRPSTCGQYRYWNGTYCADARVNPPDLR